MPRSLRPANEKTTVKCDPRTSEWYSGLGYALPVSGPLEIKSVDLHPGSMRRVELLCDSCGGTYFSRWREYFTKKSNTCRACLDHPDNCRSHDFWIRTLLCGNPDAVCDVTGCSDKRFLELHHLLGRNGGGKNTEKNYRVLTANMHVAFHRWIGARAVATPELYFEFKKTEQERLNA